ncbi:TIGR02391 family protein [Oscillospiraceae bacterium CM]|nr:TIGR02391 family protein [Oscillospiraceae bacterium CM]
MNNIFGKIKVLSKELSSNPAVNSVPDKRADEQPKHDLFDELVTDVGLRKVVQQLFRDGHHARAVEEAYKYIDNLVKKLSKPENEGLTGAKLMNFAFSPSSPILKLNSGGTTSEIDEQNGYMQIISGCMIGIRNPRAHECDWEDAEQRALQLLVLANHLVERIHLAECIPKKTAP